MTKPKYSLKLGWLYPSLMSTYGDRGNVIVLSRRCEWRDIDIRVVPIDQSTDAKTLATFDFFFAGGAQDLEQSLVMENLQGEKAEILKNQIEKDIPALFVCGAPQLMGKWYEPGVGERIEGVGIFDMTTTHPGPNQPRLIGNIVATINWSHLQSPLSIGDEPYARYIIGFENHGGRTKLGKNVKSLAQILVGKGNNGEDNTEGVVYKNAIGTYLHGPLLPKNPHIADWIIHKALEIKYQKDISLEKLDNTLEYQAQKAIAKRLGVQL